MIFSFCRTSNPWCWYGFQNRMYKEFCFNFFFGILLLFPLFVSVLCHLKFGKMVGMKHIYAKGCCLFVFFFLYGFSFILNSNLRSIWSKWVIFNFTILFIIILAKCGLFLIFLNYTNLLICFYFAFLLFLCVSSLVRRQVFGSCVWN